VNLSETAAVRGAVVEGFLGVEVEETAVAEHESVELLLALDVGLSGAWS
jgi:hypothetical protein